MNIKLYNIGIHFIYLFLKIFYPFNKKIKFLVLEQQNLLEKIKSSTKNKKNIVWFHCSSLGEFEQGLPIIEAYEKKYSKHNILVTFFSSSGINNYEKRKNNYIVHYLPFDTKKNAQNFLKIVKPIKCIFIKNEFWFNYINEIKRSKIPFYSVSTIFRKDQFIIKNKWCIKQLSKITHFFVQNQESALILNQIGITQYSVFGDSRFDRVNNLVQNCYDMPLLNSFSRKKKTIIVGSSCKEDEVLLVDFIKKNKEYNYIIAPHELNNLNELCTKTSGIVYSKVDKENIKDYNVIIIDKIGYLSNIYQYGDIAYIGGGFGKGIHNILEPIAFNLPVIFGPNYSKSNEAKELIKIRCAFTINSFSNLKDVIISIKKIDNKITQKYLQEKSGASQKIIAHI